MIRSTLIVVTALVCADAASAAINCNRQPSRCDQDNDGLTDAAEITLGTNKLNADTDADALSDGTEVNTTLTNPKVRDTDGDTLTDGVEVLGIGSNPRAADTDGDGLADGAEVNAGTSPLLADTDGDGAGDANDAFPTDPLESADTDGDGLGDNADDDDNDNGAEDASELAGGQSLADFLAAPAAGEFIWCPWDLVGAVSTSNPNCEAYPGIEFLANGTITQGGEWIEWLDGGVHHVRIGLPNLAESPQPMVGVRVQPGSNDLCYQGYVNAYYGVTVVGGGTTLTEYATGRFSVCF